MYVPFGSACDEPNSETPMSQTRIDAQNTRVARVGKRFTDGNATMAALVNALTPPTATGTCDDFLDSNSMFAAQAMAAPLPPGAIPAGTMAASAAGSAATVAADSSSVLSLPSRGASYWMQPGGPSSYPYGALQLNTGRLVPPWACEGGGLASRFSDAAKSPMVWGAVALGALALFALGGSKR